MYSQLRRICKFQVLTQTRLLIQSTCGLVRAASSAPTSTKLLVEKIEKKEANRMLHVIWTNNSVNRYPFVYLRDNCLCSECYHESSLQRSYDTVVQLDANIVADQVQVLQDGEQISITWLDKHVSLFDSEWLHSRRLMEVEVSGNERSKLNREGVEFWNAEKLQYGRGIPRYDFQELLEDDLTLFKWLNSLHSVGISLVTNTPRQLDQPFKLCSRVGYSRTTHYGHQFEARTKKNANSLSYTPQVLPLHSDQPYRDYVPGVVLIHCIDQALGAGAINEFVDGFYVAQDFRNKDRNMFELLSTKRFQFVDLGKDVFGDYDLKCVRTTIGLDENNQIVRFAYNNHVRDSIMLTSPEDTIDLYEAYVTIGKMLKDPANQIEYKMTPGDMIAVNNSRLVHGRSEFAANEERFVTGTYLDWDCAYSRMRVLATRFNIPFHL